MPWVLAGAVVVGALTAAGRPIVGLFSSPPPMARAANALPPFHVIAAGDVRASAARTPGATSVLGRYTLTPVPANAPLNPAGLGPRLPAAVHDRVVIVIPVEASMLPPAPTARGLTMRAVTGEDGTYAEVVVLDARPPAGGESRIVAAVRRTDLPAVLDAASDGPLDLMTTLR
ncbi:hypothetical protein ABGB18_01905 [Nonomuraea sp. B12E4]|uniref:hypothetical protein n=1 Tax=Nonomuraea sp. B12E4 TaxID=3153564 RepID=UPI00325E34B9